MNMNPAVIDAVDEDAAVLQFPKDWQHTGSEDVNIGYRKECFICTIELEEPYIRCAECEGVEICPPCFAQGAELKPHENTHAYAVFQDEFPLFEPRWSAHDEERLLDAILSCGYGNWEDISRSLITHTPEDCKKHYIDTYIERRPTPDLPQFPESLLSYSKPVLWPFRTEDLDEPPRHAPDSFVHRTMAGYNAARGDFNIEHDNDAEIALSEISACSTSDPDFDIVSELQVAMVRGYNEQLDERKRRHKVIRRHGLISMQKTVTWLHRYELTLTRGYSEKIGFLMQVLTGHEFDLLFEGLHAQKQTERLFANLQDFRANGLTDVKSGELYLKLKAAREERSKSRKPLQVCAVDWRSAAFQSGSARKSAGPLEIFGLPGYDRLSSSERELCKVVRIVPESYLEFKHLLQSESKKHGNLKLAQARALIKIDVNKTRKLYDFLVKEGYINQSLQVTKDFTDSNRIQQVQNELSEILGTSQSQDSIEDCSSRM